MEQKNFEIIAQNLREITTDFLRDSSSIFVDKDLSDSKKFRQIKELIYQFGMDYCRIVL